MIPDWTPDGANVVLFERRGGREHAWMLSAFRPVDAPPSWLIEHATDAPADEHDRLFFTSRREVEAARFALGVIERGMRARGLWVDDGPAGMASHPDEVELKSFRGRRDFQHGQKEWLTAWRAIEQRSQGAVRAFIWTPMDWDEIERELKEGTR